MFGVNKILDRVSAYQHNLLQFGTSGQKKMTPDEFKGHLLAA